VRRASYVSRLPSAFWVRKLKLGRPWKNRLNNKLIEETLTQASQPDVNAWRCDEGWPAKNLRVHGMRPEAMACWSAQ